MTRRLRRTHRVEQLALFGALLATFEALHSLFDQWGQASRDAQGKGMYGDHLVHDDGTPAEGTQPHRRVMTASRYGRLCATRHAATYTAGQLLAGLATTRACGYRVPAGPLLIGGAITMTTHALIDRRQPLLRAASRIGKGEYVEGCGVVRMEPDGSLRTDPAGPGTALFELDQAAHRALGWVAALTVTWLAVHKKTATRAAGNRR
ncbi:hypothetical protein ACFC26_17200 [Kitasatospora purpeofusca]|uniref:hypothetical protein n=1 Tax=Kitasatospora purpeofusca TaxID=67352 RepID=UPI0035DDF9C3